MRQASAAAAGPHRATPVVVWVTAADLAEMGRSVDRCHSESNILLQRL